MAVSVARWVEGQKFMWDGAEYGSREEADAKAGAYAKDGFQTLVVEAEGKWLAYTRRVVTEVKVEGEAPPA